MALLVVAAVLVGWSVVDNMAWLKAVAAIAAVFLGAAATRITHSELMQTRRDANRDRAQQAGEYAAHTARRVAENAAFADDMRRKILDREETIDALESALSQAQRHALDQTRKLNAEAHRANAAERVGEDVARRLEESQTLAAEAIVQVAEMESELDALRSELASWRSAATKRSQTA